MEPANRSLDLRYVVPPSLTLALSFISLRRPVRPAARSASSTAPPKGSGNRLCFSRVALTGSCCSPSSLRPIVNYRIHAPRTGYPRKAPSRPASRDEHSHILASHDPQHERDACRSSVSRLGRQDQSRRRDRPVCAPARRRTAFAPDDRSDGDGHARRAADLRGGHGRARGEGVAAAGVGPQRLVQLWVRRAQLGGVLLPAARARRSRGCVEDQRRGAWRRTSSFFFEAYR